MIILNGQGMQKKRCMNFAVTRLRAVRMRECAAANFLGSSSSS